MVKKIAIIGGGNLGSAIAKGLKHVDNAFAGDIYVTRRRPQLIHYLHDSGIKTGSDNIAAVKGADMVILAVKPYQLKEVLDEINPVFNDQAILISLAAGVSSGELSEMAGGRTAIYRVMPNTAIAIGESMTCISAYQTTKNQDEMVNAVFEPLGKVLFIPENLMGAATVLSGCGIAFVLRFIRAATEGGVETGFVADQALEIVAQTVKGAGELILQGNSHPEIEIDKVTTPRGITIAGLNEMEHQGFSSSVIKGMLASFDKIENGSKKQ